MGKVVVDSVLPEAIIDDVVELELSFVENMALLISHHVRQKLLEVPSPTERTVSLGSEIIASLVRDLPLQWRRVEVLDSPVVIKSLLHVRNDIPGNLQALNILLSDN